MHAVIRKTKFIHNIGNIGVKFEHLAVFIDLNARAFRDQVELLRHDNVVSEEAIREGRTLEGLGITPHPIAEVVPTYLWRFRSYGQFHDRVA